jgi:GNAT superfamily N-acetyltransferase
MSGSWRVRCATHNDAPPVAAAVRELLLELGGTPPPAPAMEAAARALLDDRHAGVLLVAEASSGSAGGVVDGGIAGGGAVGGIAGGVVVGGFAGGAVDGGIAGGGAVGEIVGVLGASWQTAIHVPGRYALIQDLWVHPSWRGRAIGSGLLAALLRIARGLRIARAEVGLPREGYARLSATEAFYLDHGFTPLGTRMRRSLP